MSDNDVHIDKGVPMPKRRTGAPYKYPWHDLEVGDSFVLPSVGGASMVAGRNKVDAKLNRQYEGHMLDGVYRVWRVK